MIRVIAAADVVVVLAVVVVIMVCVVGSEVGVLSRVNVVFICVGMLLLSLLLLPLSLLLLVSRCYTILSHLQCQYQLESSHVTQQDIAARTVSFVHDSLGFQQKA